MRRMAVDSGLVVVVFITLGYLFLVFGLFFYVKNEWCELLFKNNTVLTKKRYKISEGNVICRLHKMSPKTGSGESFTMARDQ